MQPASLAWDAMRAVRGSRLLAVVLIFSWTLSSIAPASSQVTREDVDEARRQRNDAQERLDTAIESWDLVHADLESTTYRVLEFQDRIATYQTEIRDLRELVQRQAVEAYKAGGIGSFGLLFEAEDVTELMTGREFLEYAANREISLLDRLTAVRNGLKSTEEQLVADRDLLRQLEAEEQQLVEEFESMFAILNAQFEEVSAEFEEQERLRRAEERRRRLAEAARLAGAAAGAPAEATEGFRCLFAGAHRFTNDWGDPRSGGRSHKGTDIVAAYDEPVLAVASGVVYLRNSRLGGTSLWLDATNGTSYYFAHLSGYAAGISDGVSVSNGQVIAYNGDSGNAKGGVPHVHLQIHPGGRGSSPVNPYPTLVEACL